MKRIGGIEIKLPVDFKYVNPSEEEKRLEAWLAKLCRALEDYSRLVYYVDTQATEDILWHKPGNYVLLKQPAPIDLQGEDVTGCGDVKATSFTIGGYKLEESEWSYLDGQDQHVKTGSDVLFNSLNVGSGVLVANLSGYSGKVGIGTSTPADTLTVQSASNQLRLANSYSPTQNYARLNVDDYGCLSVYVPDGNLEWSIGDGGANAVFKFRATGNRIDFLNSENAICLQFYSYSEGQGDWSEAGRVNAPRANLILSAKDGYGVIVPDNVFKVGGFTAGDDGSTNVLDVKGRLAKVLTGTVALTNGSPDVVGTDTLFTAELNVGDAIGIMYSPYLPLQIFTVSSITDDTHLTLDSNWEQSDCSGKKAYSDCNLFHVQNGDGKTLFRVDKSGNIYSIGSFDLDDDEKILLGTGDDGELYVSSDNFYIKNVTQDKDIIFGINDGGVLKTITWDASGDKLVHSEGTFNLLGNLLVDGGLTVGSTTEAGDNNLRVEGGIGIGMSPSAGCPLRVNSDQSLKATYGGFIDYDNSYTGTDSGNMTAFIVSADATSTSQKRYGSLIGIQANVRDDSTEACSGWDVRGLYAYAASDHSSVDCYGVYAQAAGEGSNYGIYSRVSSGSSNYTFYGHGGVLYNQLNVVTDGTLTVNGDQIICDGDLTLDPGGNDVILDNANLQIQGTYSIKFVGDSNRYAILFKNYTDTGLFFHSSVETFYWRHEGVNLWSCDKWAIHSFKTHQMHAGLWVGSDDNSHLVDDSSHGTSSSPLWIGNKVIAVSGGGTGGSGSAGAGKQYVELTIGGNTYKVLHDGTV